MTTPAPADKTSAEKTPAEMELEDRVQSIHGVGEDAAIKRATPDPHPDRDNTDAN
jgi:hypothetical protein